MEKEIKSERIEIRVTPQQKEDIQTLAWYSGLSVTAYLIDVALGDKVVR